MRYLAVLKGYFMRRESSDFVAGYKESKDDAMLEVILGGMKKDNKKLISEICSLAESGSCNSADELAKTLHEAKPKPKLKSSENLSFLCSKKTQ